MPDQEKVISVTFNENGAPQWPTVEPITMTGAGKVKLTRAPNMDWSFSDFMFYDVANPDDPTFPPDFGTPTISANEIEVEDDDETQGTYHFKYQIFYGGMPYWSPDPEIDNNPT